MRGAPRPSGAELTADVTDLDQDGRGVARVDGKVTFIRGALPGERVRYRLYRHGKQADEGMLSAVERPSAERVAPRCAHFGVCGGCSLQHLSPAGQAAFKQKQLLDALERIGKVRPEAVAPAITGEPWGYRRRARLSVKHVAKKGGVLVGFREADSPYVAQLDACVVLDPRVGGKLKALAECVGALNINTLVPQIEVAAAGTVTLVFRVMQPPTDADDWVGLADRPLPVAAATEWVVRPGCGAVALFVGTARDHAGDRTGVESLVYEAYEEQAVPRLRRVAAEVRHRWPEVGRVALLHRTGQLALGEAAVVVAVSTPHRAAAFEAARFAIDTVKASVPIWKKETWAGGESWGLEAQHLVEPSAVGGAP